MWGVETSNHLEKDSWGTHPSATRTKNKLAIVDIHLNYNLYMGKDTDKQYGVCTIKCQTNKFSCKFKTKSVKS
jgi:hypothetical protein